MKNEIELDVIAKETLNSLSEKDLTFNEVERILDKIRTIMLREFKIKRIDWESILTIWSYIYLEGYVLLILKLFHHLWLMYSYVGMDSRLHNRQNNFQYIF